MTKLALRIEKFGKIQFCPLFARGTFNRLPKTKLLWLKILRVRVRTFQLKWWKKSKKIPISVLRNSFQVQCVCHLAWVPTVVERRRGTRPTKPHQWPASRSYSSAWWSWTVESGSAISQALVSTPWFLIFSSVWKSGVVKNGGCLSICPQKRERLSMRSRNFVQLSEAAEEGLRVSSCSKTGNVSPYLDKKRLSIGLRTGYVCLSSEENKRVSWRRGQERGQEVRFHLPVLHRCGKFTTYANLFVSGGSKQYNNSILVRQISQDTKTFCLQVTFQFLKKGK